MKLFFIFMVFLTASATTFAQSSYAEAMQQGDEAFKNQQYKTAINKYFAAEAFDPGKKDLVKEKVNKAFDAISLLKTEAENAKKKAQDALKDVQTLRVIAETERGKAEKASSYAETQRKRAEKSLIDLKEITKTAIGAKYAGGIVFMWKDSEGKSGVIAAPSDYLGGLSWYEAMEKAKEMNIGGYTDWRLPTEGELALLCYSKDFIKILPFNNPNNMPYWSSTSINNNVALDRRPDCEARQDLKTQPGNVCWVRDFGKSAKEAIQKTTHKPAPNDSPPIGYTRCADELGTYTFNSKVDVAYGANGKFYYKYAVTGKIDFTSANFCGDPVYGVVKAGYYKNHEKPSEKNDAPPGYSRCADDSGSYTFNSFVDVAYGANGMFYYKYGVTGKINFNSDNFCGDPIVGVVKAGYYRKHQ